MAMTDETMIAIQAPLVIAPPAASVFAWLNSRTFSAANCLLSL